ncbi:hypothetical protein KHC24_02050 [Ancylobacter defluvii]|nr:hypothetical protein [Ancylobacter defluvii]
MNNPHPNARTTPLGRAETVWRIVEEGRPVSEVAAGFAISERTARKWLAAGGQRGRQALRTAPPGRMPQTMRLAGSTGVGGPPAPGLSAEWRGDCGPAGLRPFHGGRMADADAARKPHRAGAEGAGATLSARTAGRVAPSRHQEARPLRGCRPPHHRQPARCQ